MSNSRPTTASTTPSPPRCSCPIPTLAGSPVSPRSGSAPMRAGWPVAARVQLHREDLVRFGRQADTQQMGDAARSARPQGEGRRRMTKVIAFAGKGGTGKTTVAALLTQSLLRRGAAPILAIDADPATNLHLAAR